MTAIVVPSAVVANDIQTADIHGAAAQPIAATGRLVYWMKWDFCLSICTAIRTNSPEASGSGFVSHVLWPSNPIF